MHVVVFGEWPALASLSYAAAFKDTISFAVSPTGIVAHLYPASFSDDGHFRRDDCFSARVSWSSLQIAPSLLRAAAGPCILQLECILARSNMFKIPDCRVAQNHTNSRLQGGGTEEDLTFWRMKLRGGG